MQQYDQDWNINKGFGDLLTELIDQVNKAAAQGEVKLWFNCLRILYRNVAGHKKMDRERVADMDRRLLAIRNTIDLGEPSTHQGIAEHKVAIRKAKAELDQLNIDLITEMHNAGLILPTYSRRPELSALEM